MLGKKRASSMQSIDDPQQRSTIIANAIEDHADEIDEEEEEVVERRHKHRGSTKERFSKGKDLQQKQSGQLSRKDERYAEEENDEEVDASDVEDGDDVNSEIVTPGE